MGTDMFDSLTILDLNKADSNHTVGSIARLLRDLEHPKMSATNHLFDNRGRMPLFNALLEGKDTCNEALGVLGESTKLKLLPHMLHI